MCDLTAPTARCNERRAWHSVRGPRAGMAIVLVLGILAITMALSYSVMRSQTTAVQIQTNTRHIARARLAAMTGISAALRKMHETSWAGVATGFNGVIDATDRYSVTYTTGDSSLQPTDPNYADFPFRVTVLATGYSQDPASNITASHSIRSVVRLNPVRTATAPAGWTTAQSYTVFQTEIDNFEVNVPMRIEGLVRVQGMLQLGNDYNWSNSQRREYFEDLNTKRTTQGVDYRPFNSRIDIPNASLSAEAADLVHNRLAIPTADLATSLLPNWGVASGTYAYRLYPGGQQYSAQTLSSTLSNVTLAPDPLTNPAGIFQVVGNVALENNVSLQGTLVTIGSSTIDVRGSNVNLTPVNLPAIAGSTSPIRLPTVVAFDDLYVRTGSNASITGLVYIGDRFEVDEGTQNSPFTISGRLITREFNVNGRTEFRNADWGGVISSLWATVKDLLGLLFPDWLYQDYGLDPQPRIRFVPEGGTPVASYHWSGTAPTIFVPAAGDIGLRWDLVSWSDAGP
jgi:hypothetical protein